MKHILKILLLAAIILPFTSHLSPCLAQSALNDKADNIVGTYSSKQGDDRFKAKIVKLTDGTYRGQVIWLEHDKDAKGNKILDSKNPDKSLRNRPADQVVLFSGLKYDEKKRCWNDTKIYDPQRGVSANMTADFRRRRPPPHQRHPPRHQRNRLLEQRKVKSEK